MKRWGGTVLAAMVLALAPAASADEVTIKIASLAPDGSSWMRIFREWGQAIDKRTAGKVKVKFFAGGIAGDERDVVRKMRLKTLDGAAVTAIGLGLIQPEVRVLEIPFLIHDYKELDYVRNTLDADFHRKFLEKSYVLVGWGDVGPVHLFSNIELTSKDALSKMKMWAWTDDPLVRALFSAIGISGVPLGVPDVLTSLQTGLIDACYGSPYSTLALQWNTKVKFMSSMMISQSVGALVLTKAVWDRLPPDAQKIVNEESVTLGKKLLAQLRADNEKALKKMESLGLKVIPTPPEVVDQFRAQAALVAPKLDGELYTTEFRKSVEKLLADYRTAHK